MKWTITEEEAGARLDKILVARMPELGRAGAKRLFEAGRVRVTEAGGERGHRVPKSAVARAGALVEVEVAAEAAEAAPDAEAPLAVVLETDAIVVVDKPSGQPSAPLEPGERGSVANALLARYPEMRGVGFSPREPGLCHRLDNDTSGLLLAARTPAAFEVLRAALKEGRLDKRYLLVCSSEGLPEEGVISLPLAPHPKDRRRVYPCVHPRDVARYAPRPAETRYRVVRASGGWALVEALAPKAMRHQIRAHFAAIGHPLAGDKLYGGPAAPRLDRQALHAHYLAWGGDPVVPAFCVSVPLPPEMEALVPESST